MGTRQRGRWAHPVGRRSAAAAAQPTLDYRLNRGPLLLRLEKCASLLSRKDLAAVKRRYQQLEVRRKEILDFLLAG